MFNMTKKVIPLQFWTCFFLDSEDGYYPTKNPNTTLRCMQQGKFLAGSDPNGQYYGHALCIFICVLIYIIGVFGIVTNILNILVLRKTLKVSTVSLKCLLVLLAYFELFACLFSIMFSTVIIFILENVNRGEFMIYMLKVGHVCYSYGRTAAIYMTILVTIERYLVVAFPIKSKDWLTPLKSKLYVVLVLILTFFLDLPWILNNKVEKNNFINLAPYTSLENFPYILTGTDFGRYVYPKIKKVQLFMNYAAPFPFLLIFNGLLYWSIHNWNKQRQSLSRKQKRDINAAKMFSIVVLILLICHSVACVIYFFAQTENVVHRELMLVQMLSVTISSAINFLVYLGLGKPFRQEVRRLLSLVGITWMMKNSSDEPPVTSSTDGELSNGNLDEKKTESTI